MATATMTAPTVKKGGAERRRSPRKTVTLGGRLFYGLAGLSIDCVIRDISEHGARVAVPSAAWKAPKEIHLLSLREGKVYSGIVVWNRGRYLGLNFSEVRPAEARAGPGRGPGGAAGAARRAGGGR